MAGDRFCPLCDDYLAVELCPSHGVPTIAKLDGGEAYVKLDVGTVIAGRYRVERFMRQGGMGVVLLAKNLTNGGAVVLKVLKNDRVALRNNLRRFYQEARVITRLNHPNIVRILEFGFDPPTRVPYLAMELVEGRTIREIVKSDGPFAEPRCAAILAEVARALVEAHDKGVLHRDLKPANIMVSTHAKAGEDVKVLDFGLAKVLEPEEGTKPFTAPGQAVGTPAFMAPEQITQTPQDFRTDLYGLGCVMHVMLTGSPPFDGPDRLEVMRKQIREPPPPLPDRLADGRQPSVELVQLHKRLLMKHKYDRPASTAEVVTLLERLSSRTESSDLIETQTVAALEATPLPAPSIKLSIPEAKTVRDELEPNTQPEVEAFQASSSGSLELSSPSDSATRLLERNIVDPSERRFTEEEDAWTSVLPSTMASESDGMTPVIDGDDQKPELAVHDLRALGAVKTDQLTPQSIPSITTPQEVMNRPTPMTPFTPMPPVLEPPSISRPMPSVGAIVDLPTRTRPSSSTLERKMLIGIAIASLLAILLSVIALIARGDRILRPSGGAETSGEQNER